MMLFHSWASARCWFHSRKSLYRPQNIPFTPVPLLPTAFYNVVRPLVPRLSYIKRPQLLAICDTDSTQTSLQELCGCALYEANLGWQALFPSDEDVYHLTVPMHIKSSPEIPRLTCTKGC